MRKEYLMLLTTLVIVTSLAGGVLAAPPFQVGEADVGLEVRFPPLSTVKFNQSVTAHTHVWNKTTGLQVTNDTTQCFTHLYNSSGNHIVIQEMDWNDDEKEWEQLILPANLTDTAGMSFIIWCNTSAQGGFASGALEVTESGVMLSEGGSKLYTGVIFFFLLIAIMLFVGFYKAGKWQVKVTYGLFSYLFFVIALNIMDLTAKSVIVNPTLLAFFDGLLAVSFIVMWFMIVMVLVIWIITLFQTILLRQARIKTKKFW